jgi:hypothetical protein
MNVCGTEVSRRAGGAGGTLHEGKVLWAQGDQPVGRMRWGGMGALHCVTESVVDGCWYDAGCCEGLG